jgi:hypothetical protein
MTAARLTSSVALHRPRKGHRHVRYRQNTKSTRQARALDSAWRAAVERDA